MNRSGLLRSLRWAVLGFYVVLFGTVTWALRDPELRQLLEPQALADWGKSLLAMPMGPVMVLAGYVVAVLMAIPVVVLITVGALVFGPWPGMAYALVGMVSGAVVTYGIGHFIGAQAVDGWASSGRVHALAQGLKRRGLWAIILIRAVPLAPFVVVNMASGAFRVPLRDYVLGSFLGLAPGTIMISLFTDRLAAALQAPSMSTMVWLLVCGGACLLAAWGFKRWRQLHPD